MIIKVEDGLIQQKCVLCETVSISPIVMSREYVDPETNEPFTVHFGKWDDHIQEYTNYVHEKCPNCLATEITNLNIPAGEMDEYEIELETMPFHDVNQRFYIRKLIHYVREDFLNATTATITIEQPTDSIGPGSE